MPRLALILLLAACVRAGAADGITEFEISTPGHRPQAITTGPDGNLWVTEVVKHKLLKVTPDGKITEFPVTGDKVGVLQGIAAGPDGKIWFTSREENSVRRVTVDGKFDGTFELPSKATLPKSMTPGCWPREICLCDGKLWVAEMAANKIASVDADGKIKEYEIPTPNSQPYCVAAAPDKSVWFTESTGNKIGRLDPATGKITEFSIPTADSFTRELTVTADGSVWFAQNKGNKIGKLVPSSGQISEFPVPTAGSQPIGIVAGSDGNVWFCEFKSSKIGRITPAGKITEFDLPAATRQPFCLTSGPDGNIWVALQENRIAKLDVKLLAAK